MFSSHNCSISNLAMLVDHVAVGCQLRVSSVDGGEKAKHTTLVEVTTKPLAEAFDPCRRQWLCVITKCGGRGHSFRSRLLCISITARTFWPISVMASLNGS